MINTTSLLDKDEHDWWTSVDTLLTHCWHALQTVKCPVCLPRVNAWQTTSTSLLTDCPTSRGTSRGHCPSLTSGTDWWWWWWWWWWWSLIVALSQWHVASVSIESESCAPCCTYSFISRMTGLTTSCSLHTIQPVVKPVWQQVVSCKRGFRVSLVARVTARILLNNILGCLSPSGEWSWNK